MALPSYPGFSLANLATGPLAASAATLIGLAATWIFPKLYTLFHQLKHPLLIVTAGGVMLGLLGVIGGPITMFKGLAQMKELAGDYTSYSAGSLAAIAGIKMAAVLVPDPIILILMTIAILPAWLLLTGRREMMAPAAVA